MSPIRVVIADDHPIVRSGLTALLSSLEGIEVVGVATNGREAVEQARLAQPDVLVMDLQMPDLDGFAATREIVQLAPGVAILVLTMFADDESVFAAMAAGARGYVVKGAEQEEIERAVRGVAAGEAIFGPGVAARVLRLFSAPSPPAEAEFPQLTPREHRILDLLAGGLSNAAIASRLGLAPKTVANNVSSIFAKLQVRDRSEAIIRARDAGLGRPWADPRGATPAFLRLPPAKGACVFYLPWWPASRTPAAHPLGF
ncbi:MAG: response regulator transcription factor [Actinomycetota bacterium]